MIPVEALLEDLRGQGIKLFLDNGQLRFNAPKGAMTPGLKTAIAERRQSIVEMLQQAAAPDGCFASIPPADRQKRIPLSYAQQRLWFLDQLDGGNVAYNLPVALRLKGCLNVEAVRRSFEFIVKRHEVLRTTICAVNGKAFQRIHEEMSVPLEIEDISASSCREEDLEKHLARNAWKPFNLSTGPLLRTGLVKLQEDEHVLFAVMHHIVTDAWSMNLLMDEFSALYRAFAADAEPDLEDLPIQYADYAVWQQDDLPDMHKQLAYWREKLEGVAPVLSLPLDRTRPAVQTFEGRTISFEIDAHTGRQIRQAGTESGSTMFMVMLSAFAVLLHRYTMHDEIMIGTPVAARCRTEIEKLIGFFTNTLALRVDFSGNPTFVELLEQVRSTALDGNANQDIPFEQLVDELRPERSLSHSPLFQVMLSMQNSPKASFRLPELDVDPVEIQNESAKFDVTLFVDESEGAGLSCRWEYNSGLFECTTAERMVRHFQHLLREIADDPFSRISEYRIMDADERRMILHQWNDTAKDYPPACAHELFEQQAGAAPESIAVVDGGTNVSYRELSERSSGVAECLAGFGIGPESIVAVSMGRSIDLMTALLGILKAGAAYMPVDPSYPDERIKFMLTDSGAQAVIISSGMDRSRIPSGFNCVDLRRELPDGGGQFFGERGRDVSLSNLAYVIYTSGSTGQPKGVMITHRGLSNYLNWAVSFYNVLHGTGAPVVSSIGFDATITSLFLPLAAGKAVHLIPAEDDIELLCEKIRAGSDYSFLKVTPGHMELLKTLLPDPFVPAPPRDLILGGDQLYRGALSVWQTQAAGGRIFNEYGPTETVVGCCVHEASDPGKDDGDIVPVGRPVANTRLYVLDKYMNPVPPGVQGELYIGGHGVARGYLNRPDLTSERFILSPFSGDVDDRLYKTGDIVKFRSDGCLIYCGRSDFQVKIRGFRIELDEIASALTGHSGVRSAVVTVDGAVEGSRQLIAWYTAGNNEEFARNELAGFLKRKLPDHMIPGLFVKLDAFPLTANGKIDRTKLVKSGMTCIDEEYIAPRNEKEAILASIWTQILNREKTGVRDNFFELGGDSILSIQIVARAAQAGLRIAPRQVFQYQTIEDLAAQAELVAVPATEQVAVNGDCLLSPVQKWFFSLNPDEPDHYNQAVFLKVAPEIAAEDVRLVLLKLLEHHDALRTRFTRSGNGWSAFVAADVQDDILSIHDLSGLNAEAQRQAINDAAESLQSSLDIQRGSLMRVALFQRGGSEPAGLLIIIHHLVTDGVTWRILIEDISAMLNRSINGQDYTLPSKTSSFKAWTESLDAFAGSADLRDEQGYWSKISDYPAEVPVDLQNAGGNTWGSAEQVSVALDQVKTRLLIESVAPACNVDLQDILLTALARTLSGWTGRHQLVIDVEGHGREDIADHIDVSRTAGWFTSIFPLRLDLSRTAKPLDQVRDVSEQVAAVPGHGLGYLLLGHTRNSAVSFNYLGHFGSSSMDYPFIGLADYPVGTLQGPENIRAFMIEVIAMVTEKGLQTDWIFSRHIHKRTTIEKLAGQFIDELSVLIRQAEEGKSPAAAAFSMAGLSDESMERITEFLDAADGVQAE